MKKGVLNGIVVLWVGCVVIAAIGEATGEPGWIVPALVVGIQFFIFKIDSQLSGLPRISRTSS